LKIPIFKPVIVEDMTAFKNLISIINLSHTDSPLQPDTLQGHTFLLCVFFVPLGPLWL
jgi:hypothetical protein